MNNSIYNPFTSFDFKYKKCFLSGEATDSNIQVIPTWLLEMAGFTGDEAIKMLDEGIHSYKSLKIPVNTALVGKAINVLDAEIEEAFKLGYEGVSKLDQDILFKWLGKFLYGFVYIEMYNGIKQNVLSADGLNMGQGLMHKFGNLHAMLQGIYRAVTLENFKPYSIEVVELKEPVPFSFKDEINTLTFSLKFKNFGIIACLQDNGVNSKYHSTLLSHINKQPLLEQQFEELCARFYYSAYLFNRLPEYSIMEVNGEVFIEAMPLKGMLNKPIFDEWQHKTYGQVLENFWKPWGHLLLEINQNPNAPMSYFSPSYLPEH